MSPNDSVGTIEESKDSKNLTKNRTPDLHESRKKINFRPYPTSPSSRNRKLLFIYYATKAAQENTNIQTYKTYKKKTREAIRKTTMKLCSHRTANACDTAPLILSLNAVDRTPNLLHKS